MKTVISQHKRFSYAPVYVSGLMPLVHIYRERYTDAHLLEVGFGLPLVQLSYEEKVVGFTSAVINTAGQLELCAFSKAGFDTPELQQQLKQRATLELQRVWSATGDIASLKDRIEQLVNWLNHCQ